MTATEAQIAALFAILRKAADDSGYGSFITDEKIQALAEQGAAAVVSAK
jgi:hypothetical protein